MWVSAPTYVRTGSKGEIWINANVSVATASRITGRIASRRTTSFSMVTRSPRSLLIQCPVLDVPGCPAREPVRVRLDLQVDAVDALGDHDDVAQAHEPQPARVGGERLLEGGEVLLARRPVEGRSLGVQRGVDRGALRARVVRERRVGDVAGLVGELRVKERVELDVGVVRDAVAELRGARVLPRLDDVEAQTLELD